MDEFDGLRKKIINKQFEMIGEDFNYQKMPYDGFITIKNKDMPWWNYYKFKNEAQYNEWIEWAKKEIEGIDVPYRFLEELDMIYGLLYKYEKIPKGQLEMF